MRASIPSCQHDQISRSASTNSRMRGTGRLHGMLKRFSMCGLICEPRPRMNRPFEYACRSQPTLATVIGLRANATAMLVPSSIVVVCSAASTSGRNGSWLISAVQQQS